MALLERLVAKTPFPLSKILTDNGKAFTDRFCATGERTPTGQHRFDQVFARHAIAQRLIKPGTPQTNGMVERFNGRIAEVLATTRFDSSQSPEQTIHRSVQVYIDGLLGEERRDARTCAQGIGRQSDLAAGRAAFQCCSEAIPGRRRLAERTRAKRSIQGRRKPSKTARMTP